MHRFLLTAAFFLPVTAFAASAPESEPPTPTETTMKCTDGQVWSETAVPAAIETETEIETQTEVVTETATQTEAEAVSETATQTEVDPAKTGACVDPQSGALDDDTLYKAARELAYAEQYPETLKVLAQMSDPQDDRVLTYLGFVHRKMGDAKLGNAYYRQAIAKNPDNLLARSYMGQGFVESGEAKLARAQLIEIRLRGGRDTWPETSLRLAIESGKTSSY
jgi:hypothetical protein